jgi:2-polyprenyl-3-methyl-5-hydroxy-6-metoxy-1,4-benzoquinol methylase
MVNHKVCLPEVERGIEFDAGAERPQGAENSVLKKQKRIQLEGAQNLGKRIHSILRIGANVNPNKALWEKGDFTEIAAVMRQSGEAVVKSLGIKLPLRALDLGCGDGTTAVPLAHLGAEVVGIDIAQNLVEAGTNEPRKPVSRI